MKICHKKNCKLRNKTKKKKLDFRVKQTGQRTSSAKRAPAVRMESVRESVCNSPIALTSTEQELRLVYRKLLEMIYRISMSSVVVNRFEAYKMVIEEIPGGLLDDNDQFHFPQVDAPVTNDNRRMFLGLAKFVAGIVGSVAHTADGVWNNRMANMTVLLDVDAADWHELETQHALLAHRISLFLLQLLPATTVHLLFDRVENWNASRGQLSLFSPLASTVDAQNVGAAPCDVRYDTYFTEAKVYASFILPLLYDFIAAITYREQRQ